jgi:hypothetical protein
MAKQGNASKIGNKKKQPAMKRYIAERRLQRNKTKRVTQELEKQKRFASVRLTVPHGTARRKRRHNPPSTT